MSTQSDILATAARISGRSRRPVDFREILDRLRGRFAGTPARRDVLIRRLKIGGPIILVALVLTAYLVFRAMPQPDYRKDSLKKVFTYTLLTEEFNKLPIEKRLELIGQLVQRMKSMSAGDSVLMAAFAAGIAGKAREQIETNASRLAIDLWDKYAQLYATVPLGQRANFLDNTALEFIKTMEAVSGETSDKSDTERLTEIRQQAQRDEEALSGKGMPPSSAVARMYSIMRGNVGDHASPAQRSRGQLMVRDMMRHFRGQDGGGGG
jgi:hypothetical protein